MAMLDSLFNKGFKAAKCKTLLKLTIPRIKLLRNRREMQMKQMRRDIAKLLETGQEATARIRVEHIIREENLTAAQEIVELFCELIAVRLPIIEIQRECPLDLKEAVSSVCFAAPRCADLPELMQVQMLFGYKYGKEFVAAATELMPDSGVNRQMIELLSIRAPSSEKKMNLLKNIAEEHGVDWDPAATEAEFLKIHDDVLNGPQFVSGVKVPIPSEKHEDASISTDEIDERFNALILPEVPKVAAGNYVPVMSPIPFDYRFFDSDAAAAIPKQEKTAQDEELNRKEESNSASEPAMLYTGEESLHAKISGESASEPDLGAESPPIVVESVSEATRKYDWGPAMEFTGGNESGNATIIRDEKSLPALVESVSEETMKYDWGPTMDFTGGDGSGNVALRRDEKSLPVVVESVSEASRKYDWGPAMEFTGGDGSGNVISRRNERPPELPAKKDLEENAMLDLKEVIEIARIAAVNAENAAEAARSAAEVAQARMSSLTRENDSKIEEMNNDNPFSSGGIYKNEMTRLPSIEDETAFTYPNLFSSSKV